MAFNGGAERQYSSGWAAVPIRNIGGAERAWDSSRKRAMGVLSGRIASGSVLATDKASACVDVLVELEVAAHTAYESRDRSGGDHQPEQHRPFAPCLLAVQIGAVTSVVL